MILDGSLSIKQEALKLGFSDCGISEACFLNKESLFLDQWLNAGYEHDMAYMSRNKEKRVDPRLLVDNAKSIISVTYNYHTRKNQLDPDAPVISEYAYGVDYHLAIKIKLYKLLVFIKQKIDPKAKGRVFVDSAPVMERAWAVASGLGWYGKNTNVITRKGSFFFLGEIITDISLTYDAPIKERCGRCTRCIDACPGKAIVEPYKLDSGKCISYLTIEHKGSFAENVDLNNRVFGCDICQDVCPWNRFSEENDEPGFVPNAELMNKSKSDWYSLDEPEFDRLFKNSPLNRTGFKNIRRNLDRIMRDRRL